MTDTSVIAMNKTQKKVWTAAYWKLYPQRCHHAAVRVSDRRMRKASTVLCNDVMIDDDATITAVEDGYWVSAVVWVSNKELET